MIHRIIAAWRALRFQPYTPAAQWREEDAAALKAFLSTTVGQRFSSVLLNGALRAASTAVGSANDRDYACGFACGYKSAVASIESLAVMTSETPDSGSTGDLDHLSP